MTVRALLLALPLALAAPFAATPNSRTLNAQSPDQAAFQSEFAAAVRTAGPLAEALRGDTTRFLVLVRPFGPADLSVARGDDPAGVTRLRLFFYGAMISAAGVDRDWALARHSCDRACSDARRAELVLRADAITELAVQFRHLAATPLVALWPDGEVRVGDVVVGHSGARRLVASPEWGLLPWSSTPLADDGTAAIEALDVSRAALDSLAGRMRAAGVAALVREGEGIRAVIAGGVSTRQWGLIFGNAPGIRAGEAAADGRRVVVVEPLRPGVHYYLTR